MIEIIPAILPKDFNEIERKLVLLKSAFSILKENKKPIIQIDICDGVFVPTKTWPYTEGGLLEGLLRFSDSFDFEVDLMVAEPKKIISDWQNIGVKRIILHIESLEGQYPSDLFSKVDVSSIQFGFAINLKTSTKDIETYIQVADFFQFMGINKVGYQGEKFNQGVLKKITTFHKDNKKMIISVDGGVSLKNYKDLVRVGVNRLVVGSALFGDDNDAETIADLIRKFREINYDN